MTQELTSLTETSERVGRVAVAPEPRPARAESCAVRSAAPRPPSVELHVEELILDGFEPAQRYAFGEAFESELGRLFSDGVPAALTQDIEIAHLNGGAINLKPGASADDAGIQLARTIYGGLDK